MWLEWSITGLLLAAALWPLVLRTRSPAARAGVALLFAAFLISALAWTSRAHSRIAARQQLLEKLPTEGRPGGFSRSDSCGSCHPDQYASWHRSFHRTMTQRATPEAVRGNFTNVTLTLNDEAYHLTRRGDEFWVEMVDPDWKYVRALQWRDFARGRGPAPKPESNPPRVEKRVTMTTGSHHMQAYWVAGAFGNQQFSFPFTYLFEESRWVPRNDVFMVPPDSPPKPQVWNDNCLGCHATAGQPEQDQRTFVMNTRVAEYGIACESCHGPGEKHIRLNSNPGRRYALHRGARVDPTIANPTRLSSKKSSEVCGQCHAARYSLQHSNWLVVGTEYWAQKDITANRPLLPGQDLKRLDPSADAQQAARFQALIGYFWSDGMVRVSGREYNGLVETPCFQRGNMSCLSCHSMHNMAAANDQLARGMQGNQACYQCHEGFSKKLAQHTHHAADSSGSLCYNCHMPYTTYGLVKAIRSHQLTSPSVKSSIDTGRPDACNLCHLDRTLTWAAQHLNEWYGQQIPGTEQSFSNTAAAAIWLLQGDAGQRALIAWHMGWEPAQRASGTNWLVPLLAETLDDPYSVVRYIGQRSLRSLPGYQGTIYDYIAPVGDRVRAKREILQRWDQNALNAQDRAKVLPPTDISRLLRRRDQRPMELLE